MCIPLDIFKHIATFSLEDWRMMLAIPAFGRFSLTPAGRKWARNAFSKVVVSLSCTTYYFAGKKHRDDGPAVISKYGDQEWWKHDELHRDNGPARIDANGTQEWWKNGKRHRDGDLPAIICIDGYRAWWQHGKLHRDDKLVVSHKRKVFWHRKDKIINVAQPAVIRANGDQHWYKNGKLHRDHNLPAVINHDGYQEWYQDGNYIRIKYYPNGKDNKKN